MKRKGRTMIALATAVTLGVASVPGNMYIKAYDDMAEKYIGDILEKKDVFGYRDSEDEDVEVIVVDSMASEEDELDEEDVVYGEDVLDGEDVVYGEDVLDGEDVIYGEDDPYGEDILYGNGVSFEEDDEDVLENNTEIAGFGFDRSEYTIKLKKGAKSYRSCGMDFAEELNFDSEEYEIADIEWSVDDESIAKVDDEGYLTAVAPGSVILTASLDGEEVDCEVTIPYPNCWINKYKATVKKGKKVKLAVKSNFGTMKNVTWKSNKKTVATVKKGIVTGKKKGTAKISAKFAGKTYTCTVKVK